MESDKPWIGVAGMTKYIENVNTYLSQMKIKQIYVSRKAEIDAKKLSRILTGAQDVTGVDMEKIAMALGKNMEFFLQEPFTVPKKQDYMTGRIEFYAGDPTEKQEEFAGKLIRLMENVDEIMSAKQRFLNLSGE
ncbi:MAG: hypothetical protein LUG99_12980 [Lachnospiraceae bacterium]|nr:hypothetical protein [Lachnospiraceae bacterium]